MSHDLPGSALERFRARLHAEWLPAFADDPARRYGTAGFREDSIRLGEPDAANFLRAIDGGLARDTGGGRYQCAQSKATEQLFWEGRRDESPRPITIWLEPVITIATLARLHYDLGWPEAQLGMQTADYAFDLAAYADSQGSHLVIACEVKKTRAEADHLVSDLREHAGQPVAEPLSNKPRHLNSYRKWLSLRRHRPAFLWVVGPERHEACFTLHHGDATTVLEEVTEERLAF